MAHKTSDKSKKMSATNKIDSAKKEHHHRMGSGGYLVARPKWAKTENDLVDKGIEPETISWPDRCRTWFFGAGGTLDPVTGKCIWTDEQLAIPVKKLQQYIEAAQQGTFFLDRENDELIMALGNPEHPGRTRGTPGSILWKTLDPVTGKCIWTDEQLAIPVKKLQQYIEAAQQGTFFLDRENDELIMALGNPEHPGRTRGTPGSILWKVGFPDAGG